MNIRKYIYYLYKNGKAYCGICNNTLEKISSMPKTTIELERYKTFNQIDIKEWNKLVSKYSKLKVIKEK